MVELAVQAVALGLAVLLELPLLDKVLLAAKTEQIQAVAVAVKVERALLAAAQMAAQVALVIQLILLGLQQQVQVSAARMQAAVAAEHWAMLALVELQLLAVLLVRMELLLQRTQRLTQVAAAVAADITL
jgi:hypothetical protein